MRQDSFFTFFCFLFFAFVQTESDMTYVCICIYIFRVKRRKSTTPYHTYIMGKSMLFMWFLKALPGIQFSTYIYMNRQSPALCVNAAVAAQIHSGFNDSCPGRFFHFSFNTQVHAYTEGLFTLLSSLLAAQAYVYTYQLISFITLESHRIFFHYILF